MAQCNGPKLLCMQRTRSQSNLGAFLIRRSPLRITKSHLSWTAILTNLTRMRIRNQDIIWKSDHGIKFLEDWVMTVSL